MGSKGVESKFGLTHSFFDKPPLKNVRGLKVASAATAGSEVVSLRLNNCLLASNKRPSGKIREHIDSEVWSSLLPTTRLSIILLNEYMMGSEKFKEYLDILPVGDEMNTPIHWSNENLEKLKEVYPQLVLKVEKQRKSYASLYSLLTTTVARGGAFIENRDDVPFERLVWAMESVSSRAFSGVGGLERNEFELGAVIAAASVSLEVTLATQPSISIPGSIFDRETLTLVFGALGALALVPSVAISLRGYAKRSTTSDR